MPFDLGAKARDGGYRVLAFDRIASTNTEALARARAGDSGRLWVVAKEQTAGRGRRGRVWATPPGNLGASLLLMLGEPAVRHAATLGFVAGLALHRALEEIAPAARVEIGLDGAAGRGPSPLRFELKWPNDVVASGGKLAGILLEAERMGGGQLAVVVGIGVNVVTAPQGIAREATSLAGLGVAVDAASVFRALADAWVDLSGVWDEGRGMAEIRSLWLARCAGRGGPVALRIGGRVVRGVFETIDADGRLIVRRADGETQSVAAAEVHFGAVASTDAVAEAG